MRYGLEHTHSIANRTVLSDATESSSLATGRGTDLSLRRILPTARFSSKQDVVFTSIAASAESAVAGELIVHRIGQTEPAELIANAMARGAAGILTEQLLPCPLPQCIVGDIELAMATIAAERHGRPDRKLFSIGVIGSAGKTTTSLLLSSLFRSNGVRTAYQTDLGDCDGVVQTTPSEAILSGASLVEWLADAGDAESQVAVMELSDDEARYGHYDTIEFDMLVVTGSAIGCADYGPSGLQCALERLSEDGVVIAPADDAKAMRVIRGSGVKMVTYGVRKSADVTSKMIDQSDGMTTLLVNHQDTTAVMETSLCGAAMAANLAAATLVGLLLNQPLQEVVEKLSQLRSIPGRGQRLSRFGQATMVLDVGGVPDRVAASLRTCRSMKASGQLWCVAAIDGAENPETLARYGNLLERFADNAVLTSQQGAKNSFMASSHAVLDGVENCAALRLVADRRRAIEWTMSQAGPNDTILVFTNERHQTASECRADLETIEKWVQQAWDKAEATAPTAQLKVFG